MQGIQRRISVTLVHEAGAELKWLEVRELVVGGYPLPCSNDILLGTYNDTRAVWVMEIPITLGC